MKSILIGLSILIAAPVLAAEPAGTKAERASLQPARHVVVHLSRFDEDRHAVMMAISLGRTLLKQNAKATLFLDVEGVKLADSRIDPRTAKALSEREPVAGKASDAEELAAFIKEGGNVVVCAHCAMTAGIPETALRKGATLATPEQAAKLLLESSAVIDY